LHLIDKVALFMRELGRFHAAKTGTAKQYRQNNHHEFHIFTAFLNLALRLLGLSATSLADGLTAGGTSRSNGFTRSCADGISAGSGAKEETKDTRKMMICAAILIGVVVAMVLEKQINVPMQMSAIIGALACVLTGCLSEKQAYQGIDWTTIFLFAGMLPLASAMDHSGAGKLIARAVAEIERRGGKLVKDASCSYAAAWLKRHTEKSPS